MDEHHSPVELLPMLAAILIGAKLAGRLSQRIGLPSVFGELVLGLVLGPSLLNLIRPNDPLALLHDALPIWAWTHGAPPRRVDPRLDELEVLHRRGRLRLLGRACC